MSDRTEGEAHPTLTVLPPEIVLRIASLLNRLRDLVSLALAARGLDVLLPIDVLTRWHTSAKIYALLKSGAPLHVVERAAKEWDARIDSPGCILASAKGGRLDVFQRCMGSQLDNGNLQWKLYRCSHAFVETRPRVACRMLTACVERNHHTIVGWFLDKEYGWHIARNDRACPNISPCIPFCMREAVRRGHVETVAAFHRHSLRQSTRDPPVCRCAGVLGNVVFDTDQSGVAAWLYENGCSAAYAPSRHHLAHAIEWGKQRLVRWIIRMRRHVLQKPIALGTEVLAWAAHRGHVAMVALAHCSGVCACTPHTLALFRGRHAVDAFRWASGSLVLTDDGALVEGAGQPIENMIDLRTVVLAVDQENDTLLDWLYARPDAHLLFTVAVARRALFAGRINIVVHMHDRGWAPLSQWNALATAVEGRDLETVSLVAKKGAQYDREALCHAVRHRDAAIVKFLCTHYRPQDLQRVIDRVAGHRVPLGTLAFFRQLRLCIKDLASGSMVWTDDADDDLHCICIACHRPSLD